MHNNMTTHNFYFIRHGQSQANADNCLAGQLDTPLTLLGETQAAEQRSIVENLPILPTRIVTSNLQRAMRTADIINAGLGLPVTREPLLGEQHYGEWQGKNRDEIYGAGVVEISTSPPGGESMAVFTDRILAALKNVLTGDPDDLPLIVGHGGMANALGRRYGINLRGVRNCAFIHFAGGFDGWSALDHAGASFANTQAEAQDAA